MIVTVYNGQQIKETHNLAEKVNYKRGHRVTEMRYIEKKEIENKYKVYVKVENVSDFVLVTHLPINSLFSY
jgi:hypothetical protein